jgi:SPP1 gp7 family putative phage head morphogenesis protein
MADLSRSLASSRFVRHDQAGAKLRALARHARDPLGEQAAYVKALRLFVVDKWRKLAMQALDNANASAGFYGSRDAACVTDDDLLAYELKRHVNSLQFEFGRVAKSDETERVVRNAATATNRFSMTSQQRLIQASLEAAVAKHAIKASVPALNVFEDNPSLAHARDVFTDRNVHLITDLSADAYVQVNDVVLQGIQSGRRSGDIAKDIMGRLDVAESRAQLIARDQVLKFNGDLAKTRQQAAGIAQFTWYSSLDERVRPSHRLMQGRVFAWADPPVVDGEQATPGSPIQCRCVALPFFG